MFLTKLLPELTSNCIKPSVLAYDLKVEEVDTRVEPTAVAALSGLNRDDFSKSRLAESQV
jgi:hypothetical protein